MRLIIPGKVQILNVVQERLTDLKLRTLQDGTTLVFVLSSKFQYVIFFLDTI